MITKEEFVNWRNSRVTEAFFDAIVAKKEAIKDMLVATAGEDSVRDAVYRGYCTAFDDVLEVNVEGMFEEVND